MSVYNIMQGQAGNRLIISAKIKDRWGDIANVTSHYESIDDMLEEHKFWGRKVLSYRIGKGEVVNLE